MFAGKTDELIREINRAEIAKRTCLVFKPRLDDRWGKIDKIRSHSGAEHDAFPVNHPSEILDLVSQFLEINNKLDLVAIDETQFMDESIVEVVRVLLDADIPVIFAGLATDFRDEPFGSMPTLLAISDIIEKPTAICTHEENGKRCGQEATKTQRLIKGKPANYRDPIVLIGDEEQYQARCPKHHQVPGKPKPTIK